MIKSIIFDFDGVLVDSEILVARAFSHYMIESGYDFNQKEFSKFAGKKHLKLFLIYLTNFLLKMKKNFIMIS